MNGNKQLLMQVLCVDTTTFLYCFKCTKMIVDLLKKLFTVYLVLMSLRQAMGASNKEFFSKRVGDKCHVVSEINVLVSLFLEILHDTRT